MPELPEVQIQVDQLQRLRGRRIRRIEVRDPKLKLAGRVNGRTIRQVRRRGKFIIFDLDDGRHLLTHLRMTGSFKFREPTRWRAAIHTTDGAAYFEDSRRFGVLEVVPAVELRRRLAGLGPEPLESDFDPATLTRTSRPIKVALLDQRLLAGVGNIYASESLWRARIHPRRKASRLRAEELTRLRRSLVAALRKAIAYGPRIYEVQVFCVYERAGKPCRRCGTAIRRLTQAQRSTYFCPRCQR